MAVSLSVATWSSSLPIAYRLYLPKEWAEDAERREKAEVPEEIEFQTKPEIALDQIRAAVAAEVPRGVVLADAAYGINTEFRDGLTELGLQYVVGVQSSMTVWEPGKQPLPAKPRGKMGRPPRAVAADRGPSARFGEAVGDQSALLLPSRKSPGVKAQSGSCDPALPLSASARRIAITRKPNRTPEEWLLIEWPKKRSRTHQILASTLPPNTKLKALVKMAKHRWIIERDYEELKQELGLGHYEGRSWRGFHHHATLCIAAYGFLVAERNRFSPSARAGHLGFAAPEPPPDFRPRGSPRSPRAA